MSYNPTIAKFTLESVIGFSAPHVIPIKLTSTSIFKNQLLSLNPIAVYIVTSASDGSGGFEIYNTIESITDNNYYIDPSGYLVINTALSFITENGIPMVIPRNTEYNCISYVQFNNNETSVYSDDTPIISGPAKPMISDVVNSSRQVKIYLDMSDQDPALIHSYTVVLSYVNENGTAVVDPHPDLIEASGNYIIVDNLSNVIIYWAVVIANGYHGNSEVSDVLMLNPNVTPDDPVNLVAFGSYDGLGDLVVTFDEGLNWTPSESYPYTVNININDGQLIVNYVFTTDSPQYAFQFSHNDLIDLGLNPGDVITVGVTISSIERIGNTIFSDALLFVTPDAPQIYDVMAQYGTVSARFNPPDNGTGGVDASSATFICMVYDLSGDQIVTDPNSTPLQSKRVSFTDASSYYVEFTGLAYGYYAVKIYEQIIVPTDFTGIPSNDFSGNAIAPYPDSGIIKSPSDIMDAPPMFFSPSDPAYGLYKTDATNNDTHIPLGWTNPTDYGTGIFYGYRVIVYSDESAQNVLQQYDFSGSKSVTDYTVYDLSNGTDYWFTVEIITTDISGNNYYSDISNIAGPFAPFVNPPTFNPVSRTSSVLVVDGDNNPVIPLSIQFIWRRAAAGTYPNVGYEMQLYEGLDPLLNDVWTPIDVSGGLSLNRVYYIASNLKPDTKYTFLVRAISDPIIGTTTYSPTYLTIIGDTGQGGGSASTPIVLLTPGDKTIYASWEVESTYKNVYNLVANRYQYMTYDDYENIYLREPDPSGWMAVTPNFDSSGNINKTQLISNVTNTVQYIVFVQSIYEYIYTDTGGNIQIFTEYSNYATASATPFVVHPTAPLDFVATPQDNSMILSWVPPSELGTYGVVSKYQSRVVDASSGEIITPSYLSGALILPYTLDASGWFDIAAIGTTNFISTLYGLNNGRTYVFYLRGVTVDALNQQTNPLYGDANYVIGSPFVTPPSAPVNLNTDSRNNSMILSWNPPSYLGSYGVISKYQSHVVDASSGEIITPSYLSGALILPYTLDASGWFDIVSTSTDASGLITFISTLYGLINAKTYIFYIRGVTLGQPNQQTNPLYGDANYREASPAGLPIIESIVVDGSGNLVARVDGNGSPLQNYTLVIYSPAAIYSAHVPPFYTSGDQDGFPRPQPDDPNVPYMYTIVYPAEQYGYLITGGIIIASNSIGQSSMDSKDRISGNNVDPEIIFTYELTTEDI